MGFKLGMLVILLVAFATCCNASGWLDRFKKPKQANQAETMDPAMMQLWQQFQQSQQPINQPKQQYQQPPPPPPQWSTPSARKSQPPAPPQWSTPSARTSQPPAPPMGSHQSSQQSSNSNAWSIVPFKQQENLGQDDWGQAGGEYEEEERRPLTQEELGGALDTLYNQYGDLDAVSALDLLQAVDPFYDLFKDTYKTPVDSRRLLQYSQEIEEHCHDKLFYKDMVRAKQVIKKKYRSLANYIEECILSYQEVCESQTQVVEKITKFKEKYAVGWSFIDKVYEEAQNVKEKGFYDGHSYQLVGLLTLMQDHKYHRFGEPLIQTCPRLVLLADELLVKAFDQEWHSDNTINEFVRKAKVCRELVDQDFQKKVKDTIRMKGRK